MIRSCRDSESFMYRDRGLNLVRSMRRLCLGGGRGNLWHNLRYNSERDIHRDKVKSTTVRLGCIDGCGGGWEGLPSGGDVDFDDTVAERIAIRHTGDTSLTEGASHNVGGGCGRGR